MLCLHTIIIAMMDLHKQKMKRKILICSTMQIMNSVRATHKIYVCKTSLFCLVTTVVKKKDSILRFLS